MLGSVERFKKRSVTPVAVSRTERLNRLLGGSVGSGGRVLWSMRTRNFSHHLHGFAATRLKPAAGVSVAAAAPLCTRELGASLHARGSVGGAALGTADEGGDRGRDAGDGAHAARHLFDIHAGIGQDHGHGSLLCGRCYGVASRPTRISMTASAPV